jgi:hypothetical protein
MGARGVDDDDDVGGVDREERIRVAGFTERTGDVGFDLVSRVRRGGDDDDDDDDDDDENETESVIRREGGL